MLNQDDYTRELLGLKDVIVKDVENDYGKMVAYIELERKFHQCPKCGQMTNQIHDCRHQRIKGIRSFGKLVILDLRKRRYVCPKCGKRFFEDNDFLPRYYRMTGRKLAYMASQLHDVRSMKSAGIENAVSGTTVARIFDHVTYGKPKLPETLSIDEFRGNAGGQKFQCILTNPKARSVLDILPRRNLEDICEYFGQFEDRKIVKCVVMDMSTLFKSAATRCFPKADIVADKFHVLRQVSWALERVRKDVQGNLPVEKRRYFKRSRHILLKDPAKLKESEIEKLEIMLRYSEELRNAYKLKCAFSKVYSCSSREEARKELRKWIVFDGAHEIKAFDKCCETFKSWREEILNYYTYAYTNGYTEGTNNKIKVIKRNAFGVRNFDRFRNRILHCCYFFSK